jgi:hypothetical protein
MRTLIRPKSMPIALAAPAEHEGTIAAHAAGAPPSTPGETANETNAPNAPAEEPAEALQIKRLVVTDRIEGREPGADAELRADGTQVFAFVELSNSSGNAQSIEIVFEHESGQQVGFVTLPVPQDQSRWRTWGKTQQIKKTGRWVAKVRTAGGNELMRQDFVVGQG